jgi:SAM-dependent methyltransferase
MSNIQALEKIRADGRNRLHPPLTNPSWLVLRKRREIFTRWLQQLKNPNLIVLDVGGRVQPYRPLVASRASRYIAVDLLVTPLVDIVGNAAQLPLQSASIDLVLCTQMLEYAPDPRQVIAEIHRVLKPSGLLLLSAPAVYPQDSEQEYWRFLPCALRELLVPFSMIELVAEGNSLSGFLRTINVCMVSFAPFTWLRKLLCFTAVPLLNLLGAFSEILKVTGDTSFTTNFSVLARK